MKSIRTMLLFAVAAAVLAVPATASAANWKKEGKELGLHWTQEGSLELEGDLSWGSHAGNVSCPVTGDVSLSGETGGEISDMTVTSIGGCNADGEIASQCTGDSVTSIDIDDSIPITPKEVASEWVIDVSSFWIVYQLEGGPCDEAFDAFIVSGAQIATPDNSGAISSLDLSGPLKWSGFKGGQIDYAWGTSSFDVSPAGEYGITNERNVDVEGNIRWDSQDMGSVNCSLDGTFVLEAGSTGQFISTPSGCTGTSAIYGTCTGLTTNSPTLINDGTHITIQSIELTGTGQACNLSVSGNLRATPDRTGAISSVALSGTLGGRPWTGTLNWTPAGVYGL
jgi:hypothetical protein